MNRRRNAAVAGIFLCALFAALFSCTKVDNTVGSSLIPNDQQMQIFEDTVSGIDAYLQLVDSLPMTVTNYNWYYGCMGAKKDPVYGAFESGWLGQYGGASFYSSNEEATDRYGTAPVGDSICLYLTFESSLSSGDTAKTQTFNVYEVTKRLYVDSIYYLNHFDVREVIDPEPLLTFDYKLGDGTNITKRMTSDKAVALMNRLLKATTEMYEDDSLFVNEYKGIYVAPADNSPRDAAALSMLTTSASMQVYAHNFTDETATTPKDTVIGSYSFGAATYTKLMSLNTYKHDYTGSEIDPAKFNDTASLGVPVSVGYVQGCGGVTSFLHFTKEFVENLKALKTSKNTTYKTLVINSARIEIGIDKPDIPALDAATTRLGFYTDYATFSPISDYPFELEVSQYNPVTLSYGGYMNRSRNSYTMDITRAIQVMADVSTRDYWIEVAPSFFEIYNPNKEVRLNTSNDPSNPLPLRVAVTYTLIR